MSSNKSNGFTAEEKAAMKERAKELKVEARANKKKEEGEKDLLEKVAEMSDPDHDMAKRLHEIPRMPRTARSSASSKAHRSSTQGMLP